ncbi:hypothetical protein NKG94_49350 [Micromonospora sp. M12]
MWADRAGRPARLGPVRLPAFTTVESDAGGRCTGDVRYLPHSAAELLGRPAAASRFVVTQVRRLADAGAELVGLGGATSIVGSRVSPRPGEPGRRHQRQLAHRVRRACPGHDRVGTTRGACGGGGDLRGGLARDGGRGDREPAARRRLPAGAGDPPWPPPGSERERLPAGGRTTVTEDLAGSLARTRLVVAASSAGGLIDPAVLLPAPWWWTWPCPATSHPAPDTARTSSSWTEGWSGPTSGSVSTAATSDRPPS